MRGDEPLVFNSMTHVINAALDGPGLAYAPEPLVAEHIAQGRPKEHFPDHHSFRTSS